MIRFHLIHTPTKAIGVGEAMFVGWVKFIPADQSEAGFDQYLVTAPQGCGLSEDSIRAYAADAVWSEPDPETGEQALITPAVLAEGAWWLAWTWADEMVPEVFAHRIVSSWGEHEPMVLPAGVVRVEPLLSGVVAWPVSPPGS